MDTTAENEEINIKKQKISKFEIQPLHSKSKNSYCWQHFGRLGLVRDGKKKHLLPEQVFCNVCLCNATKEDPESVFGLANIKAYSKNVSTGNLIRHLKEDHNIEEPVKTAKHAANIQKFFSQRTFSGPSTSTNTPSRKKWLLARDFALWFGRSLMPFDTIDNDAMVDFLKKYNVVFSEEELPSRTTISRDALDDVYSSMVIEMKKQISLIKAQHVAMTTDLWSDSYRRRHYITLTLHFIDDNDDKMNLISITLETVMMMGKKTGERVKEAIESTRERFGILDKEIFLVTDSGSNVKKAAQLMPDVQSHFCLGHGLHNLVSVDGFKGQPEINNIIKKCKKIVKTLRYRAPELELEADKEQKRILMAIQDSDADADELDVDISSRRDDVNSDDDSVSDEDQEEPGTSSGSAPTLKTETSTRWHSALSMLQSISHPSNKGPVNTLLGKVGKPYLKLDENEWKVIHDLIKLLKKIKQCVEILSCATYTSINVTLVLRSEIEDALSSHEDNTSLAVVAMTTKMKNMLNHRFPITDLMVVASLLDPRFYNLKTVNDFLDTKNMTKAEYLAHYATEVLRIRENSNDDASTTSEEISSSSVLMQLASKYSAENSSFSSPLEMEAWKYCCSVDAAEVASSTILEYWRNRKNVFPRLYTIARAVLSIPATSTPSERVFSVAGMVVTAKRSRLSPSRVDKIIFIHDNYNLCKL